MQKSLVPVFMVPASAGSGEKGHRPYKSFPVQSDDHYLTVLRYIEYNPLRAGLVQDASQWRWSSLSSRLKEAQPFELRDGPVELSRHWSRMVNTPSAMKPKDLEKLSESLLRGRSFLSLANGRVSISAPTTCMILQPIGSKLHL